ncbi:MAG TPA: HesA/MoeB/ThiF family protein [Candidatus Tenderia electrophaga]|uniref:Molybdopterin-synthase adenylyltransferase n=1 Tax=Candidatus Tenderia electrophaga TaxID=1748243 RepID=A0A832N3L0_9GAMM|nr:HesA/MoeB/ThiF family protein [Candidatus Tenderia electrophaga]
MSATELNNDQLNRYSRHLLLPEIDLTGQARLSQARAVIIGAGGLGSPVAMYLASSGVGHITIFDDDNVDLGNLQRQIAFTNNDIEKNKAQCLRNTLLALNPEIEVEAICHRADTTQLRQITKNTDVLIDCCDNFTSRFSINQTSIDSKTPLVSGAAIRFQGQVAVFDPRTNNAPCYQCLYNEDEPAQEQQTCRDRGVFAPLVGIIGSIQAAEALKVILNIGKPLTSKLLTIDTLSMSLRQLKLSKDPACPTCGSNK